MHKKWTWTIWLLDTSWTVEFTSTVVLHGQRRQNSMAVSTVIFFFKVLRTLISIAPFLDFISQADISYYGLGKLALTEAGVYAKEVV